MRFDASRLRINIFLSSPGDVKEERSTVKRVFAELRDGPAWKESQAVEGQLSVVG